MLQQKDMYAKCLQSTGLTEADVHKLQENAEILLCDPGVLSKIFYTSKSLKWAQTISAGVDILMKAIDHKKPLPCIEVTRTGEGFGEMMAEYVLAQMISMERKFLSIHEDQKMKQFNQSKYNRFRLLSSLRIGIIGAGQIGMEVAGKCKQMGMEVWILSRQMKENTSSFHMQKSINQLPEFLRNCDYIFCALPNTSDTQGMLSGDILENCKERKSIFINVGRGNVIDDQTIEKAIRLNWIGGAILDVFNTEPLPEDSILWTLPNVVITPHVSGPSLPGQVAKAFLGNYKTVHS